MAPVIPHITSRSLAVGGSKQIEEAHTRGEQNAGDAAAAPQESATIRGLDAVNSVTNAPFLLQLPMMALMPVGWVAGKLFGAKAGAWVQSPMTALNGALETPLNKLHHLPTNMVRAVANSANENAVAARENITALVDAARDAGKPIPQKAVEGLERKADALRSVAASAERAAGKMDVSVARPIADAMRPMRTAAGHHLSHAADAVANSDVGKGLEGMIGRVADWRMARLQSKAERLATQVAHAHTHEAMGMLGRVKQFFGAAPVMATGTLDAAQPVLRAANGGHADGLRMALGGLESAGESLAAEQKARLGAIASKAGKLASVMEKRAVWESVKQGGVGAFLQQIPKTMGNTSLLGGLLVAGFAATAAATVLRTRDGNRETQKLHRAMAADVYGIPEAQVTKTMLGGANAPTLLKQAGASVDKQRRGEWGAAALQVAGSSIFIMPGVQKLGIMAMAPLSLVHMGAETAASLIKVENPYLQAYGVLKAEAKGRGKLTPEQKIQLVTALVGAAPSVAEHGGARNKMAKPIAEQMVAEGLSVQQIVREIASSAAIEKRAVKVHEVMVAKAANVNAPAASAKVEAPVLAANENTPTKQVGAIEPQGRITQHAVAANR